MNLQVPVLPILALLLVAAAAAQPPDTDLSRAQQAYERANAFFEQKNLPGSLAALEEALIPIMFRRSPSRPRSPFQ